MHTKEWELNLDGKNQIIKVNHGNILRKFTITLNDQVVEQTENVLIDKGNRVSFKLGNHLITILILFKSFSQFEYSLIVDGKSIETGELTDLPPEIIHEKKGCMAEIKDTVMAIVVLGIVGFTVGYIGRFYSAPTQYNLLIIFGVSGILFYLIKRFLLKKE